MRVIRSLTGCWLSNTAGRQHLPRKGCWAYRHRMVSNNPLIMKANATA
jgi:hypothetical protein